MCGLWCGPCFVDPHIARREPFLKLNLALMTERAISSPRCLAATVPSSPCSSWSLPGPPSSPPVILSLVSVLRPLPPARVSLLHVLPFGALSPFRDACLRVEAS